VESYQFLLREYPKSRFTQEVLLRVANIAAGKTGRHGVSAMKTYQDFLNVSMPGRIAKRSILAELSCNTQQDLLLNRFRIFAQQKL